MRSWILIASFVIAYSINNHTSFSNILSYTIIGFLVVGVIIDIIEFINNLVR